MYKEPVRATIQRTLEHNKGKNDFTKHVAQGAETSLVQTDISFSHVIQALLYSFGWCTGWRLKGKG